MGRRSSSVLEDFLDIATKLPWWLSVVLAIVLYFFLHSIAITETPTVTGTHNVGNAVTGQVFKTFAGIFQYVLPGILLIGAGACFPWPQAKCLICACRRRTEVAPLII